MYYFKEGPKCTKIFFSHPQLNVLRLFIIWQSVPNSSADQHQAIVKERECVQVSARFHFHVEISCQKINCGKIVSCVYLKIHSIHLG